MANAVATKEISLVTARKSVIDPALLSITDYNLGNPFPYEYDDWREIDQRNYENGRFVAAEGKTSVVLQMISERKDFKKINATLQRARLSIIAF